eukprot:2102315-Pyramimonas_sp.AAC.1
MGTPQAKFKHIEDIHEKAKLAMAAPKKKRRVQGEGDTEPTSGVTEVPTAAPETAANRTKPLIL